ncbi:MAG: twitching motility protein PilT [Spirochaetes bacterium GWB1_59_5]|nr:MAG: twitching motility protein PilT [Spirochaetes bacterium GWB1_59_5]
MNILLDTHIALWSLVDDSRLDKKARTMIEREDNRIFWSVASMWEVAIKHSLKPDRIPLSGAEFLHYCEQAGYECLPIRERHVMALESLPLIHADPFDRILVSQALAEAMVLLTHDTILSGYGEPVVVV